MKTKTYARSAVVIAVITLIVLVLGILTNWFVDWNKYCLFGHDYDDNGVCTKCGNELIAAEEDEQPVAMAVGSGWKSHVAFAYDGKQAVRRSNAVAIGEDPIGSQTLIATVTPSYANIKNVRWVATFRNADSEWASGKSVDDYVVIDVDGENELKADVFCYQPFGEKIDVTITVTDYYDVEKSATCVFDFVKPVVAVTITGIENKGTFAFGTEYTIGYNVELGVGTVDGEFTGGKLSMKLEEIGNACLKAVKDAHPLSSGNAEWAFGEAELSSQFSTSHQLTGSTTVQLADNGTFLHINGGGASIVEPKVTWQSAMFDYVKTYSDRNGLHHATIQMAYTYSYQGESRSSGIAKLAVFFDLASVSVGVSNIELSETEIAF